MAANIEYIYIGLLCCSTELQFLKVRISRNLSMQAKGGDIFQVGSMVQAFKLKLWQSNVSKCNFLGLLACFIRNSNREIENVK